MSRKLLLPNRFKAIGWFIFIPATIAGIYISFTGYEPSWLNTKVFAIFSDGFFGKDNSFHIVETNITNTLVGAIFIVGSLFVGFSKEKKEDEFIAKLRLSSLLWAVWVNYILLLFAFLFIYGTSFLSIMVYNMFTVMIIFIVRFNYIFHKNSKLVPDEK